MNDNNDTDLIVRKRIINHRNKQIETRIKRHVIIENGQMILDSGPQVTTKTIEDTRQESEEYDKNGQQTHYTSNDDDDQINKNDDGNKVVNDTNKCHKSNLNKTYLFGEDMIKRKTTNRINIPKYYYGSNPSKNFKTEHSTMMKMNNNLLMKSNSIMNDKAIIDEQDCQYAYETDRFSRRINPKYGNETNHHPEYNKRTQLWSL